MTVSIGVATFPSCADDVYSLFDAADEALAWAQKNGRSQAVLAHARTLPASQNQAPAARLSPACLFPDLAPIGCEQSPCYNPAIDVTSNNSRIDVRVERKRSDEISHHENVTRDGLGRHRVADRLGINRTASPTPSPCSLTCWPRKSSGSAP